MQCDCRTVEETTEMADSIFCFTRSDFENALLGCMPIISDNGTTAKLVNHILLILKRSLYEMRSRKVAPSIFYIMNKIKQIRDTEYQIAKKSDKLTFHFNKWDLLNLQVVNP